MGSAHASAQPHRLPAFLFIFFNEAGSFTREVKKKQHTFTVANWKLHLGITIRALPPRLPELRRATSTVPHPTSPPRRQPLAIGPAANVETPAIHLRAHNRYWKRHERRASVIIWNQFWAIFSNGGKVCTDLIFISYYSSTILLRFLWYNLNMC
jgi:hypothetical protein